MNCIKESFALIAFIGLTACSAFSQSPTPTPVATPPPLPQIIQVAKPRTTTVDAKSLPAPFHTESARRSSRVIPQPADAKLTVPKGFKVNVYAEGGFTYPRWMALAPEWRCFRRRFRANSIVVLRTRKRRSGRGAFCLVDKLAQLLGWHFKRWFYVANTDSVVRFTTDRTNGSRR